jgi:EKC/KEOPS complex subunit PCC1/LAGE3
VEGHDKKSKVDFNMLPLLSRTVRVPFLSEEHAQIARDVIDVDRELQPHAVERSLRLEGNILVAYVISFWSAPPVLSPYRFDPLRTFRTLTLRLARLTMNSFLENVDLVVRTLGEFGDDANVYNANKTTS